jgi:hypothetical protein
MAMTLRGAADGARANGRSHAIRLEFRSVGADYRRSAVTKHEHSTAPVAAAVVAVLLIGLVLRQGWAWWLLAAFEGAVLVSFAFDFTTVPALLLNLASFALLVSPPMRRHVRRR